MKLKTLKDIETNVRIGKDELLPKWELRQEAIKHIKFMESKPCTSCECCDFACQKDWIKHFFNITEEELK